MEGRGRWGRRRGIAVAALPLILLAAACSGSDAASPTDPIVTPTPFATADVVEVPTPLPAPSPSPTMEPTATATAEPKPTPPSDSPYASAEAAALEYVEAQRRLLADIANASPADLDELHHPLGPAGLWLEAIVDAAVNDNRYFEYGRSEIIAGSAEVRRYEAATGYEIEAIAIDICTEPSDWRAIDTDAIVVDNEEALVTTAWIVQGDEPLVWGAHDDELGKTCSVGS